MSEAVMRRLAKPLLFLAAFIWGTSFFIMKNTLDAVPPFWLLVFRFTTGAVLLGLFCWKKWRTHFTRDYLWRGGLFGVFLFIAYTTQTFGLTGTTPSKNAFLTATYCVLVPFLAWRVFHRRPDQYNLLAAFPHRHLGRRPEPVQRPVLRPAHCGGEPPVRRQGHLLAHHCPICLHRPALPGRGAAVPALPRQVWSEPSSASVILSLESVFGVLFSVLFYGDPVSPRLLVGFGLIFIAVLCSETKFSFLRKKNSVSV